MPSPQGRLAPAAAETGGPRCPDWSLQCSVRLWRSKSMESASPTPKGDGFANLTSIRALPAGSGSRQSGDRGDAGKLIALAERRLFVGLLHDIPLPSAEIAPWPHRVKPRPRCGDRAWKRRRVALSPHADAQAPAKVPSCAGSERAGGHDRDDAGQPLALHQNRLFVNLLHGMPPNAQDCPARNSLRKPLRVKPRLNKVP